MALATVVHPALAPSRRILAVSDIHGNRAFSAVCWKSCFLVP